jgi:hypothetical protein
MAIECLSGSDGKEGIAKAANLLCSTYLNGATHGNGKREPTFTEVDMASALKAIGMLEKLVFTHAPFDILNYHLLLILSTILS